VQGEPTQKQAAGLARRASYGELNINYWSKGASGLGTVTHASGVGRLCLVVCPRARSFCVRLSGHFVSPWPLVRKWHSLSPQYVPRGESTLFGVYLLRLRYGTVASRVSSGARTFLVIEVCFASANTGMRSINMHVRVGGDAFKREPSASIALSCPR
jgi:hypothetical protein